MRNFIRKTPRMSDLPLMKANLRPHGFFQSESHIYLGSCFHFAKSAPLEECHLLASPVGSLTLQKIVALNAAMTSTLILGLII
jgi:hypothetical protein